MSGTTFHNIRPGDIPPVANAAERLALIPSSDGFVVVQLDTNALWIWDAPTSTWVADSNGGGGSGVSSLNSLTGALTIVAGTGVTVTPSGSNITVAASYIGMVETISLDDINSSIGNNTYTLELYAEYGYTINELKIISTSGTCTAAVKINGTNVTGISAVSVSSTIATGTATAANTVVAGNKVTLVLSTTSSLTNLQATLKTTRT